MNREEINSSGQKQYRVHVLANGRLNIPSQLRKAAKINDGDELILTLKDNAIQLQPIEEAINEAQALVAQYFAEDDLNEELKTMRSHEAKSESIKYYKEEEGQ